MDKHYDAKGIVGKLISVVNLFQFLFLDLWLSAAKESNPVASLEDFIGENHPF